MNSFKNIAEKKKYYIEDLLVIIDMLRSDKGCPWDKIQTHKTLRKNILEEAYEVVETIDDEDIEGLKEELGDLLMQIVFHSDIERKRGNFDFSDVCDIVCKKLIIRHPHVFEEKKVSDVDEVLRNWDDIKRKINGLKSVYESLRSLPHVLPQLMRAQKIQNRINKGGYSSKDLCASNSVEWSKNITEKEVGDILFSVVNIANENNIDCEEALSRANNRVIEQFKKKEKNK